MTRERGSEAQETGVRVIVTYKVVKAILQVAAAIVLFYGVRHGLTASLTRFADHLRHHAVHAWSNIAVHLLERFLHAPRSILWTAYAALADAVLSGVEGYALSRGYAWGEWLVVVTTGSLIPFEIYALTRHLRAGRVLLLVVNLVVVTYLLNRTRKRRAEIDAQLVTRTDVPGAGSRRSGELVTSGGRADEPRR